jgi:hypothetical protein
MAGGSVLLLIGGPCAPVVLARTCTGVPAAPSPTLLTCRRPAWRILVRSAQLRDSFSVTTALGAGPIASGLGRSVGSSELVERMP